MRQGKSVERGRRPVQTRDFKANRRFCRAHTSKGEKYRKPNYLGLSGVKVALTYFCTYRAWGNPLRAELHITGKTFAIENGKTGENRRRKATGLNRSSRVTTHKRSARQPSRRKAYFKRDVPKGKVKVYQEIKNRRQENRRACVAPRAVSLFVAGGLVALSAVLTAPAVWAQNAQGASVAEVSALAKKADTFLQKEYARTDATNAVRVIVQFAPAVEASDYASVIKNAGGSVYLDLRAGKAVAATLPRRSLSTLAANPRVVRLSADVVVKKSDVFTVESSGASLVAQYAPTLTGKGVGVAVVDTGVQKDAKDFGKTLSDSATRVVKSVSFGQGKPEKGDDGMVDKAGHGTHVAGIIAGNGKMSTGANFHTTFYGIAREANIINVRVLDNSGAGSVSGTVAGIDWVIANRTANNIRVLNLSLGHPVGESYQTDPLCQAVERAWNAGIVVVCAAGNDGRSAPDAAPGVTDNEGFGAEYGSIQSPANDPLVITVGAMKQSLNGGGRATDKIATYSGRGPSRFDFVLKPDLVAPGNKVISLEAKDSFLESAYKQWNQIRLAEYSDERDPNKTSEAYFVLSGTSMAAPVVSGAAAVLLQKYPTLSPDTVKARLMLSADKWGFPNGDSDPCTFGAGYLNIPNALLSTVTIASGQRAVSPPLERNEDGGVDIAASALSRLTGGKQAIWGTGSVFDTQAIWGTRSFRPILLTSGGVNDTQAIWGTRLFNSQAIWGNRVWRPTATAPMMSSGVDLSSVLVDGDD